MGEEQRQSDDDIAALIEAIDAVIDSLTYLASVMLLQWAADGVDPDTQTKNIRGIYELLDALETERAILCLARDRVPLGVPDA